MGRIELLLVALRVVQDDDARDVIDETFGLRDVEEAVATLEGLDPVDVVEGEVDGWWVTGGGGQRTRLFFCGGGGSGVGDCGLFPVVHDAAQQFGQGRVPDAAYQ